MERELKMEHESMKTRPGGVTILRAGAALALVAALAACGGRGQRDDRNDRRRRLHRGHALRGRRRMLRRQGDR